MITATDAQQGLDLLQADASIKVIVSDLKMPGKDGISFLEEAKEILPDAIRILLTGYADLHNALDAVNKGNIFRLLNKPCSMELLITSINDGLHQHHLIADSRELYSLKKLKHVMNGIVSGLSTLIESRDPYTAGHQRRVAALACKIGRELGYTNDQLEALHIAGMLHDIGKVYVPSDFLNKPGKLSHQEFAIINQHPEVGASILKDVEFHWPISEIILQHHERLDGSGYPNGLKGESILPAARILAVCDVIDAMSSRRPYREALGIEAALENLEAHSGTLYDSEMVGVCLDLFQNKGYSIQMMEQGVV